MSTPQPPEEGNRTDLGKGVTEPTEKAREKTISQKRAYAFHRFIEGATELKTSELATTIIENV